LPHAVYSYCRMCIKCHRVTYSKLTRSLQLDVSPARRRDGQQRRSLNVPTRFHLEQRAAVLGVALLHPVVVDAESAGVDRPPESPHAVRLGRQPRNVDVLHRALRGNLTTDCKPANGDHRKNSALQLTTTPCRLQQTSTNLHQATITALIRTFTLSSFISQSTSHFSVADSLFQGSEVHTEVRLLWCIGAIVAGCPSCCHQ